MGSRDLKAPRPEKAREGADAAPPGSLPIQMPRGEQEARFHLRVLAARSRTELASILVNELAQVLSFSQASFLLQPTLGPARVVAVSNLVEVDRSSPYCVWIRRAYRSLQPLTAPRTLTPTDAPSRLDSWDKFTPPFLLVVPLPDGPSKGALFLARYQPWSDKEVELAAQYMRTAAAALALQTRGRAQLVRGLGRSWRKAAVAALVALGLMFPIRLASVAPAEIVPESPETVSSAIAGSVKRIAVLPNQRVKAGDILVHLEDTERRARLLVAESELRLAETEVRRLSQLGFQDPTSRWKIAEAQGQVELKKLERDYAAVELDRTTIRAARDGIAIVSDPLEWEGRPVQVGERILMVADPSKVAVRLWVPAADGAVLEAFSSGQLFLDTDPWRGRGLGLDYWSFEPELSPHGVMAYRAKARIAEADAPRIGLRGTAHLEGERVAFAYYILRRVIISLRQSLAI